MILNYFCVGLGVLLIAFGAFSEPPLDKEKVDGYVEKLNSRIQRLENFRSEHSQLDGFILMLKAAVRFEQHEPKIYGQYPTYEIDLGSVKRTVQRLDQTTEYKIEEKKK